MAGRTKRENFAPVDAAWLRMDRPTNLMMVSGVIMFDRPLDITRLKDTVERRLLRHERFRQRVRFPRSPLGSPQWEIDPHFNIDSHIHRIGLPPPGDVVALQELVGDLMSVPLDFTKPLWQIHVVENFGQGSALIVRLHHCIADGLALVQVLLSMTDRERDPPETAAAEEQTPGRDLLESLLGPVASVIGQTMRGAEMLLHEGWETLLHPTHALELAKVGTDHAVALGKLLLTLPDRRTILRGSCGVPKRAVWSPPIPLADVKATGHALGGTVNDILLTAVAGALRRYLEGRQQPTDGLGIRAMVPVNLRQPHELGKLGNRFGLVILSLPVGIRDPLERLAVLKQRMDDIKGSPEATVAYGILNTIGLTPLEMEKIIVDIFAAKVSAVMTNVPGPKEPLYLAGSRLDGLMFWVPAAGNLGLGISILSYAGSVILGFATDAGLIPDPETIIDGFHDELAAMRESVHVDQPKAAEAPEKTAGNGSDQETTPGQCQALTRSGRPCRNRPLPGSTVCRVHVARH